MTRDGEPDPDWIEVDRRTLRTSADPDRVWSAWAHPERLRQWFPDEARGEAVPGGELVHVWNSFGGMESSYRVLEVEPGRRLLLQGAGPIGLAFRQEISVARDGGETVLTLVHFGFDDRGDWEGEYEGVDSGWQLALATLRHYLEHHYGQDRKILFHMRPTDLGYETIQPLFRSESGLARWLTRSGSLEGKSIGESVALELSDGASLTGRLLADSGRELALSWREISGVLELKIFRAGPRGLAAAVRCSAWGALEKERDALDRRLAAALDRLVA